MKFFPSQPVTWDNPDILLTELDGTPVDRETIEPSHDYRLHATIHNASFNPALGVAVTCRYRAFGFSALSNQPIETEPDGAPRQVPVDIPAWGQAVARFRWRTPEVPGHYCLLVECSHPADSNGWNNVGQENVAVRRARAGDTIRIDAVIANVSRDRPARVAFTADGYVIPESEIQLRLNAAGGVESARPERFAPRSRGRARPVLVGREALLAVNQAAGRGVPEGWGLDVAGGGVELRPQEERSIAINLSVPADAPPGRAVLNVIATPEFGEPGGVTIHAEIVA